MCSAECVRKFINQLVLFHEDNIKVEKDGYKRNMRRFSPKFVENSVRRCKDMSRAVNPSMIE